MPLSLTQHLSDAELELFYDDLKQMLTRVAAYAISTRDSNPDQLINVYSACEEYIARQLDSTCLGAVHHIDDGRCRHYRSAPE